MTLLISVWTKTLMLLKMTYFSYDIGGTQFDSEILIFIL